MSAFLVSTFVEKQEQANRLSYSLILGVILCELLFTNYFLPLKIFYSESLKNLPEVNFVRGILEMVPTYVYSLNFGIVADESSKHLDLVNVAWLDGHTYTWEQFETNREMTVTAIADTLHIPAPMYFLNKQKKITFWLSVMFWYFDHVISSNRGAGNRFYFPVQPSYWLSVFPFLASLAICKKLLGKLENINQQKKLKRKIKEDELNLSNNPVARQNTLNSSDLEKDKVLQNEMRSVTCEGLRVVGIEKKY